MKPQQSLALLSGIYLLTQVLGLYLGAGIVESIKAEEIPPVIANPESMGSSITLLLYVLVLTALLLVLMKYHIDFVINTMLVLSMFMGMSITLAPLTSLLGGMLLSLALAALVAYSEKNIFLVDVVLILTTAGLGSWLGASLSVKPAMFFLILLCLYDPLSVFVTKHMVTLAENAKGKFPFMFLVPVGREEIGLGTGDVAIPLVFSVSVLRDYQLQNAIITSAGGLIGLLALFAYTLNKKKTTLPALPPIGAGLIAGLILSFFV